MFFADHSGKFSPGRLFVTPGLLARVSRDEFLAALNRHISCDWGDLPEEDQRANDSALRHGGRLLSCYYTRNRVKFWIITEADRSCTTILLPEEY